MRHDVAIHTTAIVAPDVEIGPGTVIGPFAVILAPCRIGADCWIGPHVVLGGTGEHLEHGTVQSAPEGAGSETGEDARRALDAEVWFGSHGKGVEIGAGTIIREHTTVHQGIYAPTIVGEEVFLMNKTHVAHDAVLGDRTRMAPMTTLAGHVVIGHDANLGMSVNVHQWKTIGPGVMLGMNATLTRDAAPYTIQVGSPARPTGINRVLLERMGHSQTDIDALSAHLAEGGEPPAAFAADFAEWEQARRT